MNVIVKTEWQITYIYFVFHFAWWRNLDLRSSFKMQHWAVSRLNPCSFNMYYAYHAEQNAKSK